jgi:hypothetical protein
MYRWALLGIVLLAGCRKSAPPVASAPPVQSPVQPPGTAAPPRTYRDLKVGETLTVITPMRKTRDEADWRYGMPNTSTTTGTAGRAANIDVTITLDPQTQFGFERTQYLVKADGLHWVDTVRNTNGTEAVAPKPLLELFPAPKGKYALRILFLTRASDLNYNTAIIGARSVERLGAFTGEIRREPEKACVTSRAEWCVWIPPGVAAR